MKIARAHWCVLFACLGCGDRWEDAYDFEWRGEYVTVYGYERDEGQACGGSLQATDDYVGMLLEFHGSDAAVHVDYRWFSRSSWASIEPCGGATACTYHDMAFTRDLVDQHEMVHALRWTLRRQYCPHILEEGVAEYLEGPHQGFRAEPGYEVAIASILTASDLAASDYEQAGHFVSFLHETYGFDVIDSLCDVLSRETSLDDWDAATKSALGLSLDEVLAAYAAYPFCNHHQYRARLRDCAGDPEVIVSATELTEFSFRFACDEPDVIGEAEGTMMLTRRVEVPIPGEYAIEVDDGSPPYERKVQAIHEQCASCSQAPLFGRIEDVPLPTADSSCIWVYSPAVCGYHQLSGMHTFVFFLDEGLDRDVTVRIVHADLELP